MQRFASSRGRQRGAAALFAAIAMLGMVVATAFAIDLAQLFVAQRQLQNMANLAALDVARAAGGCLAPNLDRQLEANVAALNTINRLGGESAWLQSDQVVLGRAQVDSAGSRSFVPLPVTDMGQAYAFRLNLARPLPNFVLPVFQIGSGAQMSARAASVMAPRASFDVASFVASIDATDQSVLNALLQDRFGQPLNITVLSYQGLLSSSVDLVDVADQMPTTALAPLLGEPTPLPGLLAAVADSLFMAGNIAASEAFDAAAAVAPNESVVLGEILGSPNDTVIAAGNATINSLVLLQSLAMQVGDPVIALTPGLTIPPVTTGFAEVLLGNPPTPAAGPALQDEFSNYLTSATNSQGLVTVELGLPLLGDAASVTLELEIAEAQADLLEIDCADRGRPEHEVDIGVETSIATLRVNNPESNPLVNLAGLVQVCWQGEVDLGEANYDVLTFTGPFDPDNPDKQPVGSSIGASLSSAIADLIVQSPPQLCGSLSSLNVLLLLLGIGDADSLIGALVGELLPGLTGSLDAGLLDPLLQSLGLSVGGAHVSVLSVEMSPPALIEAQ